MTLSKLEVSAAVGITGWGIWQLRDAYSDSAPSLASLRDTDPTTNDNARQKLLDADMMVGALGLLAGATASLFMRSAVPLLIVAIAFGILSFYHHSVANGPTIPTIGDAADGTS